MGSCGGQGGNAVRLASRQPSLAILWLVAVCVAARAVVAADDGSKPVAAPSLKEIKAEIEAAEELLADERPAKAAAALASVVERMEKVAAGGRPPAGLRPLLDRCRALKSNLELEGVDVAAITLPSLKAGAKAPAENTRQDGMKNNAGTVPGRPAAPRPAGQAVSFSKDVAPVLLRSCGGCHVSARKGGFQFTAYADLMQTGLIQPGTGEASRLVEVIVSGDMPRGGGKVGKEEIAMLVKWIDGGAMFDGADPLQALAMAVRPAPATPRAPPPGRAPAPTATLVSKLEPGAVSFSMDVAPVLIASCYTCHGGNETEQGFSMKTFERLLAGGRSGAAIMAGRGGESLLVKKLKGPVGDTQRMPLSRPPLSDDVIALIERWITEGARLDARSATEELPTLAAAGRARKLSHEDLAALRLAAAKNLWSRALPDEEPQIAGSVEVRVIGNLSASRTKDVAEKAQEAWRVARREFGAAGEPLKGGVVVYAFSKAIDLSEFWQVRHGKERPQGISGVGGVAGDVVYAAVVMPSDEGTDDAAVLVMEQMVAAMMAARAAPVWFAEGAGRAVAARAHPKAPRSRGWRAQLPESLAIVGSADAFFAAEPAEREAARTVAGAFVGSLIGPGGRMKKFIAAVDSGTPFDQAFADVFGGPPPQLFNAWAMKESAGSQRR